MTDHIAIEAHKDAELEAANLELQRVTEELQRANRTIAEYQTRDTDKPPPASDRPTSKSGALLELAMAVTNLGESSIDWMGRIDRQMGDLQKQMTDIPMVIRSCVVAAITDTVVNLVTRVEQLERRQERMDLWQRTRAHACEGCPRLESEGL